MSLHVELVKLAPRVCVHFRVGGCHARKKGAIVDFMSAFSTIAEFMSAHSTIAEFMSAHSTITEFMSAHSTIAEFMSAHSTIAEFMNALVIFLYFGVSISNTPFGVVVGNNTKNAFLHVFAGQ